MLGKATLAPALVGSARTDGNSKISKLMVLKWYRMSLKTNMEALGSCCSRYDAGAEFLPLMLHRLLSRSGHSVDTQ
jgi:hypothetical protein